MVEHIVHVGRDVAVGREKAQIRVQACRAGVVVAGTQVAVAHHLSPFTAGDQQHLGVRLEPHHTVHDLRPHRLKGLGPVDVGLLVKPGFQLHHGHHLLATAHSFAQQVQHLRIRPSAVNGLLDSDHLWIVHCLSQEGQYAIKTLEGLMQQHIPLLELFQNRRTRLDLMGPGGAPWGKHPGRIGDQINELRKPHQVHRALHAIERGARQVELAQQKIGQVLGTPRRNLQPHCSAEVAVLQALAQHRAKVAHIFLIHRQVGMPRDPKLRELHHLAAGEQIRQVRAHHAGDTDKLHALGGYLGRHAREARQQAWDANNGDLVLTPKRVAALEAHDEVQRFVRHLGERVRRVQADGYQQRAHLAHKILMHPATLGSVALTVRDDAHPFTCQRRHQRIVVQGVLAFHQVVRLGR